MAALSCSRLLPSILRHERAFVSIYGRSNSYASGNNQKGKEKVYLNEVRLLGRVGSDPQLRGNPPSTIAAFPMVTSTFWSGADGVQKERKDWHRVVCGITGLRDRVMASIVKGDRVFVMGSIQYREMMDENGNRTSSTYISAARVLNLTNKKQSFEIDGEESMHINDENSEASEGRS